MKTLSLWVSLIASCHQGERKPEAVAYVDTAVYVDTLTANHLKIILPKSDCDFEFHEGISPQFPKQVDSYSFYSNNCNGVQAKIKIDEMFKSKTDSVYFTSFFNSIREVNNDAIITDSITDAGNGWAIACGKFLQTSSEPEFFLKYSALINKHRVLFSFTLDSTSFQSGKEHFIEYLKHIKYSDGK